MFPFISTMIVLSVVAMAVTALADKKHSRLIATAAALMMLLLVLAMLGISLGSGSASFSESYPYISSLSLSIGFRVGASSLVLLLMSSIVLVVTAFSGNPECCKPKAGSMLTELFQIAAIGLFSSSNLFVFLVFWSIGVVVMFLMINVLGGANRVHASMSFMAYEAFAAALILFGVLMLCFHTPLHSFDIQYITANSGSIAQTTQTLVFAVLFVAFMAGMPIFPMHFWFSEAHAEAPTQGSMMLSVFTQFGAFGMLLLFTMLPIASKYAGLVAALATFSAVYSALVLIGQREIKRIVASSSMVGAALVLLGISAANGMGTSGALYLMLSQGLAASLLFLVAGSIKQIFGERDIRLLKGVVIDARATAYTFVAGALALSGFPLTASFIGYLLVFMGSVQAFGAYGVVALLAPLLMGAFMYSVISKSVLSAKGRSSSVDAIGGSQHLGYALLLVAILLFGVLPFVLLGLMKM
jgi:NADH-quinone oxidoreductase subunit M